MKILKRWIDQHKPMVMIMIITFILVLILNGITPYLADDFTYMRHDGFFDIFYREYLQYMNWGGRSVAHICVRLMLVLPKMVFNIINAMVFVIFTYLIYEHTTMDDPNDHPWLYGSIITSVFLVVPYFGQTCLWLTGSCNYLWTSTLILGMLYPLHKACYGYTINHPWLLTLLGLGSGWSNENSGGAALMLVVLLMIIHWCYHDHKIKAYLMALFPTIIGLTIMVLAPGNYVRAAGIEVDSSVYGRVHRFMDWINIYMKNPQAMVVVIVLIACLGFAIAKQCDKRKLFGALSFMLAGLACSFVMLVTPVAIGFDRSQFFAFTCYLIAIWILIHSLVVVNAIDTKWITITCGMLSGLTMINYGYAIVDIGYLYYQYLDRGSTIALQKANGNADPVVAEYNSEFFGPYDPNYGLFDVTNNQLLDTNKDYAAYYGLTTIRSTDPIYFQRVYRHGSPTLMAIQSFDTYMDTVVNDPRYTVLISANGLDRSYASFLSKLPSEVVLDNRPYMVMALNVYGYDTVLVDESPIEYYFDLYKGDQTIPVYLSSYDGYIDSDIVIDGIEYTMDNRGITIVTYDNSQGMVVDVVNFDSEHGPNDAVRYHYELGYNLQWDD